MSRVHYFADGYLLEKEAEVRQSAWVCLFNPAKEQVTFHFTFYYTDVDPTQMSVSVPAETGCNLQLLSCREIHQNKRFGAKIESSVPAVVQVTTGYYGMEDKHDWYTRAMHSVICSTRLSKVNYYADGLVIDVPGQRLKEPEWAFILNPNKVTARVALHAFYRDGEKVSYRFRVEPERLLPLFMDELVRKNVLFGAKYTSNVPVAIQQTRLIEEEDRKTIRACFSAMARTSLRG